VGEDSVDGVAQEELFKALAQLAELMATVTSALTGYRKSLIDAEFAPVVVDALVIEYGKLLFMAIRRGTDGGTNGQGPGVDG
jgi:hypothetical protein